MSPLHCVSFFRTRDILRKGNNNTVSNENSDAHNNDDGKSSSPNFASNINPLSANPTKWSDIFKRFVGKSRCLLRIWSLLLKKSLMENFNFLQQSHLIYEANFGTSQLQKKIKKPLSIYDIIDFILNLFFPWFLGRYHIVAFSVWKRLPLR